MTKFSDLDSTSFVNLTANQGGSGRGLPIL